MEATSWRVRDREIDLERPIAAGIVNVTGDSFFSGARSETPERAVADGVALAAQGFDMIDIGAVAARSGPAVDADEEAGRLVPAVQGLVAETGLPISVDTFSVEVARRSIDAGAVAINDISGVADPEMWELAAETGCGLVVMHIEGPPRQDRPQRRYDDVVEHLKRFFSARIETGLARGVAEEQMVLDPGFDFDLGPGDGLALLGRLGELHSLGLPLYVALSRKDFLGAALAGSWEDRLPPEELEWATAAAVTIAVAQGAQVLRIHDTSSLDAMKVAGAIARGHVW